MKTTRRGATSSRRGLSMSERAGLHFPVSRVAQFLKGGKYSEHVKPTAPVYLAAALQYMAAKLLELSGKEAKNERKTRIQPKHIDLAIRSDADLDQLLRDVTIPGSGKKTRYQEDPLSKKSTGAKNKNVASGSK